MRPKAEESASKNELSDIIKLALCLENVIILGETFHITPGYSLPLALILSSCWFGI